MASNLLLVAQVSILGLLSPLVATLAGRIVVGQTLSTGQLTGAVLVFGAVWLGQTCEFDESDSRPLPLTPTTPTTPTKEGKTMTNPINYRTSATIDSTPTPRRPGLTRTGVTATALLLGVGSFQTALALGAPWGRFAWGGAHEGTLPDNLRVASTVSSVVYAALATLAVSGPRTPSRQRGLRAASALFALGTVMNLASPSMGEKLLWAPVSSALSVVLWRRAAQR